MKSATRAGPLQDKPKVLKFSGIPNQNSTELAEKYKPLAKYLALKLDVPVEYVPAADYNATVDGFKNGDLQLCWFGGFTGVQARSAVEGARAICCGPRDMKFKSYFVANKSLGLKKQDAFPISPSIGVPVAYFSTGVKPGRSRMSGSRAPTAAASSSLTMRT